MRFSLASSLSIMFSLKVNFNRSLCRLRRTAKGNPRVLHREVPNPRIEGECCIDELEIAEPGIDENETAEPATPGECCIDEN